MKKRAIVLAIAGIFSATVVLGDQVVVKSEQVDIRSGEGPIYPVIANAPRDTALTVITQDEDWYQIHVDTQTAPIEGYVYKVALTETRPEASKVVGSGGYATVTDASAGKGMEPSAVSYGGAKNLKTKPLQDLIDYSKSLQLTPKDFEAFTAAGQVGKKHVAAN